MHRPVIAALLALLLPACRAGYILKQYSGQRHIQSAMRPIEDVLADPGVDETAKTKLRWVLRVRDFGIRKVGLTETKNYTYYYDTGGTSVAWNVTACRKYAFRERKWWFPIVGSVPYLGFFDKADALAEQKGLNDDGWDTHLSEVAAYNTLGWFVDPVFSPMLKDDVGELASTILHEMTHGTVYLAGQSDFDETLAEWTGNEAGKELVAEACGADSPEARRLRDDVEDEDRFNAWLNELHKRLEAFYAQPMPREEKVVRREEVFRQAKEDFAKTLPQYHDPRYVAFEKKDLNNALILSYGRYHARTDLFDKVFAAHGRDLRATVAFFKTLQGEKDARATMERWLTDRSGGARTAGPR